MSIAVSYEWDAAKARVNRAKHGVHFADATAVLEDDFALTMRDPYCEEEERWVTMGKDALDRILVVYAWRGDSVRLISARRASVREKKSYEERHET